MGKTEASWRRVLLAQGDTVLGLGLQEKSRHVPPQERFAYAPIDLRDKESLSATLINFNPTQAYHLAAVHGAAGFPYEAVWCDAVDVNLRALHVVLEYARIQNSKLRIAYASSSKVFGTPLIGCIGQHTARRSDCLYSITKNSAEDLLAHYRREHGIFGAVAYLFNHESERRGEQYFIPTLMGILSNALKDRAYQNSLQTLDFYCDWGSAREYMRWFKGLLDLDYPKNLIFATTTVRYGRDFVAQLFDRYGLDSEFHVIEKDMSRQSKPFTVSIDETTAALGVTPEIDIFTVCDEILTSISEKSKTPSAIQR